MTLKEQVVAHWQRMHDDAEKVRKATGETPGTDQCAYCMRFFDKACLDCPIRATTGEPACYGSPYECAVEAWTEYCESGWHDDYKAAWQAAAQAEIDFLKTLPDKEA